MIHGKVNTNYSHWIEKPHRGYICLLDILILVKSLDPTKLPFARLKTWIPVFKKKFRNNKVQSYQLKEISSRSTQSFDLAFIKKMKMWTSHTSWWKRIQQNKSSVFHILNKLHHYETRLFLKVIIFLIKKAN